MAKLSGLAHDWKGPFAHVQSSLSVPFYISYFILLPHLEPRRAMQDPRFCSACGLGLFANVKNHLKKCKEIKKCEVYFMDSIWNMKRHGPMFENKIRKWWQPPNLTLQVGTSTSE